MTEKEFFKNYCQFIDSVTSDAAKNDNVLRERTETLVRNLNGNFARMDMAVNGLSGEAGEVADLWKKIKFHGQDLDEATREDFVKELGDLFWYLAQASLALNVPLEEIVMRNEAKLKKRHPQGFSGEYLRK